MAKHFQSVFAELVTGGKASLVMQTGPAVEEASSVLFASVLLTPVIMQSNSSHSAESLKAN